MSRILEMKFLLDGLISSWKKKKTVNLKTDKYKLSILKNKEIFVKILEKNYPSVTYGLALCP